MAETLGDHAKSIVNPGHHISDGGMSLRMPATENLYFCDEGSANLEYDNSNNRLDVKTDWWCEYCRSPNPIEERMCTQCGAPKPEPKINHIWP